MSDTFSNTDVNADKIRKDILDLKDKKRTLILSLQNDIDGINGRMTEEFCLIGEKVYELYIGGDGSLADLKEDFASIGSHKADRSAKEKKIEEITGRYDEEITLLEKLVPAPAPVHGEALVGSVKGFCVNCGAPYNPGVDVFCAGCGSRL